MFLFSDNGEIEAVNTDQIEKLYLRYPSPNFGVYYDVVAIMASGREYVVFRGYDVDSATETLYHICDEINEIDGKAAPKDD
jgi:hypothetical protein